MRYEDWDILLFPRGWEVPQKEFKVACHVVHDPEFSHAQGSFGLPTLCCFVPSLPVGATFKISIHSWSMPAISQFTKSYSMYPENAEFEFRLFIDGGLVASASVNPESDWPHIIAHSFDFSKNGDLEPLKFPSFRKELLEQNYWSPADNLGRIKLVISEGFPRDSLSMPMERVKNLVAFSFQHAPLEILESSSIAWPNPSMWRREPFTSSMPVPTYASEDVQSHAHSPRRRHQMLPKAVTSYKMPTSQGGMANSSDNVFARQCDPLNGPAAGPPGLPSPQCPDVLGDSNTYFQWLRSLDMTMTDAPQQGVGASSKARRSGKASTDISMPDYASIQDKRMSISEEAPFTMSSFQLEEEGNAGYLKAPSNTPTGGGHRGIQTGGIPFPVMPTANSIPPGLANTLTNSLLNQAMLQSNTPTLTTALPEGWPCKETQMRQPTSSAIRCSTPGTVLQKGRNVSQRVLVPSKGSIVTSANGSQARIAKDLINSEHNQRTPSMGGPGETMLNLEGQENVLEGTHPSSDGSTNRTRHFTPVSGKVMEDKTKGQSWASPRIQLTPFVEDSPTVPTS